MDHLLFTPREIKTLVSKSDDIDTSYIDTIKVRVARRTPDVEAWSLRYLTAKNLLRVLETVALSESDENERLWFIPKSPSRLFLVDEEGEVHHETLHYCGSRTASVRELITVYDRPRRELLDYLTILGAGKDTPEGDLTFLRYDIGPDKNGRYIRLTWKHKKHPDRLNVIYLHRGNKEKKK